MFAAAMPSLATAYDQVLLSQCPCLLTATCVPNTPCYNSQRVRRVRRSRTVRGGCSACNGQGPCTACQQAPQKQYEAVPVFMGEPQVYETVGARRPAPSYTSYTTVQQPISQYNVQQVPQYTVQQAPQYIVQQPVQQLPIMQPAAPQVSTISQQYVYPQVQRPCNNCNAAAPIQRERVYVPLKPGFFQRLRMNRAVKQTAARQPCNTPSCNGAQYQIVQQPSYTIAQQAPSYQVLPSATNYPVLQQSPVYQQQPAYQMSQQPTYQVLQQQPLQYYGAPIPASSLVPVDKQGDLPAAATPTNLPSVAPAIVESAPSTPAPSTGESVVSPAISSSA